MKLTVGKDNNLFCYANYQLGDIKKFIKELDDIDIKTISSIEDKEYEKIVGITQTKLSLIEDVMAFKKMQDRTQDLVDLGAYLQKIGKELEEFGKNHKSNDSEVKKSSDKEIIDKIINDIKELMKNWIQKQ